MFSTGLVVISASVTVECTGQIPLTNFYHLDGEQDFREYFSLKSEGMIF